VALLRSRRDFPSLLAAGQIRRLASGLAEEPSDQIIDLAACCNKYRHIGDRANPYKIVTAPISKRRQL
jgi:hypothetical protein